MERKIDVNISLQQNVNSINSVDENTLGAQRKAGEWVHPPEKALQKDVSASSCQETGVLGTEEMERARRGRSRGSEAICRSSEQFSAHTDSNIHKGAEGQGHWAGRAPWCKLIRVGFEKQQFGTAGEHRRFV